MSSLHHVLQANMRLKLARARKSKFKPLGTQRTAQNVGDKVRAMRSSRAAKP